LQCLEFQVELLLTLLAVMLMMMQYIQIPDNI
jgi:hypothetical protein